MKKNYLTGDEFEKLIYESLLTSKLVRHLFSHRIEPYYYEHQLDYTQAVLYEVLFNDFDTAIEQYYALEEKEVSFAEVARQYVRDPQLRRQHGNKGILSCTALNSAISTAVFASDPPQIIKPVVVGKKSHLILVEEIVQPELDEALRNNILAQLFADWLETQVQQYSIEVESLKTPQLIDN